MKKIVYVAVKGSVPKNLKYLISPKFNVIFINAMNPVRHPQVALNMPKTWPKRIIKLENILNGLSDPNTPWFTTPPTDPTIPIFKGWIQDLTDAYKDVINNVTGAKDERDAAFVVAHLGAKGIRNYVQSLCDKSPEHAVEIAHAVDMELKNPPSYSKPDFSAVSNMVGSVELSSHVKKEKCHHEWAMTKNPTDPMGWNAVLITSTQQGKTTVTGLTSDTRMYFRHRKIYAKGPGDWSAVLSVMVK
jgi:hypothetical protein